ncbi:response regulator [Demequina capsici]|uniref:Response regulator n=1 Tax=Demequina capsici TaxID=3075620 RepID=A0AA96FFE7_9MICO|nr:response regulator [Demequina sp. PMTSA13]WNM27596.1 response regulator [Demequina sp. PMTSA13]
MQRPRVLVVDDDEMIRALVSAVLTHEQMDVIEAESGPHALEILSVEAPDLVISDVMMPQMDGFQLITKLRATDEAGSVPVLFLTSRMDPSDAATGLRLGANEYLRKPFTPQALVEQVQRHLADVGGADRTAERRIALHDVATLREQVEAIRASGRHVMLARITIEEQLMVEARFASVGWADVLEQLGALARARLGAGTVLAVAGADLLVGAVDAAARTFGDDLAGFARDIADARFAVRGESVRLTPSIGWSEAANAISTDTALERTAIAAAAARDHLDLQPVRWRVDLSPTTSRAPSRTARFLSAITTPYQILLTLVLGLVVPFFVYQALYWLGWDISVVMYPTIVIALAFTGVLIWSEGFYALDPVRPPKEPGSPPPPATAVIAAYLPNEAATIVDTVEAFLRVDYPDLQVILAYNTPRGLLVERTLRQIAERDPRFLPLRVDGSTSKAQNVNAALRHARGEFVGMYDADHHPQRDSFMRAWRWLSNGYDVVQGHCVIRNGAASKAARTVAVEFEAIYAVSHPGRAQLHGFGIFGGSNGFWRTDVLRRTRMHGFMLTEDIDSSLRVIEAGGQIANDPALISRELAPTSWHGLWNQRMRWAQGWFQVSKRHLRQAWRSRTLTLRQKLGMTVLLGWREVYPWISIQMFPLVAFLAWRDAGLQNLDWFIALFVLTTLFTTTVGPGQTFFAWRLAAPDIRRHRRWFWLYLLFATLFYTEWKNTISRVAQVKETIGERQWKVTPR